MATILQEGIHTSPESFDFTKQKDRNKSRYQAIRDSKAIVESAKKSEQLQKEAETVELEKKKHLYRQQIAQNQHPFLEGTLSSDKRSELLNKLLGDIDSGVDIFDEKYLSTNSSSTPASVDDKVAVSAENPEGVVSTDEGVTPKVGSETTNNTTLNKTNSKVNSFSHRYKTDGRTYVISNAEVDAMEAAYKGHAATLKGRKQKDYIEGYTQILNALREGKSPSASSQTYSGQHFWSFMDQLKPEQGEDKTTLDTTPESKYNLYGLLTRDVYHGDYSALEKDLSTPFVRTDQNKLDLDVRLDNVYNAAKNLGYTGEKTEEGLKEYLVRGNHLNSDQFNRYLGIGQVGSSSFSPGSSIINLPDEYKPVEGGVFLDDNIVYAQKGNDYKIFQKNAEGLWIAGTPTGKFSVKNDTHSFYTDPTGKIVFDILPNDPGEIEKRETEIKENNAPIMREVGPMKYNYILESLGLKDNHTVLDISDGFDQMPEGKKLVIDSFAGRAKGDFNNRTAQLYDTLTGKVFKGTIGKSKDGTWILYTGKNDQGQRLGFTLGKYDPGKGESTLQDWIGAGEYNNPMEDLNTDMEFLNVLNKKSELDRNFLVLSSSKSKDDPMGLKVFPFDGKSTISENLYNNVVKNDKKLQKAFIQKFAEIDANNPSKTEEAFTIAIYKLYNKGFLPIPHAQKEDFLNKVYRIFVKQDPVQQTQTATKKLGGIVKALTGAEVVASMRRNEAIQYTPSEKPQPVTHPTAIWNKDNKEARIGTKDVFAKEWTGHDMVRAGTVGLDAISAIASFIPGAGTAVAMGAGLIATAVDMINDLSDDDIDSATAWKNVGLNLGLTAIGMIPGARFMKLAKSAKSARGLTKSAETAIQAAQKAGKLPIGDIAGEMTQKALRSADDMLKKEGVVKDAIKSLGQANKYIAGGAKVLNAGMMTVGVGHGIASGYGAVKDISEGDGISLDQLRGIIGGIGGIRGLKWKFYDKPALKAVTKPIGVSDVIEDIPLKKQKFTLVKGKGKDAIKETVEVDYKPGMTPDEVKAAAKLKLQEEGLKLVGVDETRFNKMAELESSDFEIENADNFFKRGTQHISEGLDKVKSKTAKLFVIDLDLDNIEVKSEDELLSSGYGILERHGLNLAKKYGIASPTSIDAYKQNLETRVPQFHQEEYNKRFMEELDRIQVNKRGGIIKGEKGIDHVTKFGDQTGWNKLSDYNKELNDYYKNTNKTLEEFNALFDEYHGIQDKIKYDPTKKIAIKDDAVGVYQQKYEDYGLHLPSFKTGWEKGYEGEALHTSDRWVNGVWLGPDKIGGYAQYNRTANLFNEAELAEKQEAVKDKGWEWYEDTTHKGRDGRKFYYLRKKDTTGDGSGINKTPGDGSGINKTPGKTTDKKILIDLTEDEPERKKSGIDITAITELPELIGSRLTNKRNYETMMKVTPALPQTYSWYEAVKNNLPYEQLSRKSAAAQLNLAEKQAMNIADPARRQAIMQEATARALEITDRAAIANQEMYAQTKGQQEQNALKETAMHTDNANQINSILSAHKLLQAQLEAGKRTANNESTTRYLNRIKQNADLILKSRAIELDKDAQRNAESEMQKINKSLNLKYPYAIEESAKALIELELQKIRNAEGDRNITLESVVKGSKTGETYLKYFEKIIEKQTKAYNEEYSAAVDQITSQYNLDKSNYIHPNWITFQKKQTSSISDPGDIVHKVVVKAKGGQLTYAERAALIKLKASYKQMSDETKNIQKSIDRGQRQVERILDGLSKERYMVVKHMLSK